jgi:hypothetical protein
MREHDRNILDRISALRASDWTDPSPNAEEEKPLEPRLFAEVPIELILPTGSGMAFSQVSTPI